MFAPAYRPQNNQVSYIAQQQKQQRKRRRLHYDDEASTRNSSPEFNSPVAFIIPISSTDPYHVAGYSHERSPPPPPYPIAPALQEKAKHIALDEALFKLKEPIHRLPDHDAEVVLVSKRQHLDNLTALLHKCVAKSDWNRAYRILGLMLRTEVQGEPVDLRLNHRWAIAAEVILKRGSDAIPPQSDHDDASNAQYNFEGARAYYERLALQYPHTVRSQHTFNATTIYPSLFNIWIYEVQQRLKRADQAAGSRQSSPDENRHHDEAERHSTTRSAQERAVTEAESIATRFDELLTGPPYDTNLALVRLRRMLAAWIADLCDAVLGDEDDSEIIGDERTILKDDLARKRQVERQKSNDLTILIDELA